MTLETFEANITNMSTPQYHHQMLQLYHIPSSRPGSDD